jgi:hypothetical protein
MKAMKLKIKFSEETRFGVPNRRVICSWKQLLFGTQHSVRSLVMAELEKPCKHGHN